jgi:anti-anti-sigma factor
VSIAVFRSERADDTVTVHVEGQVDLSSADDLSAAVNTVISTGEPPPKNIWVDLTDVSFFDSAGVNALFALNHELVAAGRSLGVIAPGLSPARRVLDIVQLGRLMPLVETSPPHRD